jgi:hypothetical protein
MEERGVIHAGGSRPRGAGADEAVSSRPGVPREREERRAAYRIPEHRASRWGLLLAADRLDVLERRARGAAWLVPALAAGAIGYALVARALARRR